MIEEILPRVNQIQINCWWIFDSARYIKTFYCSKNDYPQLTRCIKREANLGFRLIKYSFQLSIAQTDSSTRIPVRDQWGFCDDQCSIERSDMSTIKHRKNENVIWLIFLNSYTFKIVET